METKPQSEAGEAYTLALPEGADVITKRMVQLPPGFTGRVVIPEGVRKIHDGCFKGRPITAVSFPKSLREIGAFAFQECRLTELRVEGDGEKVKIESGAFWGNSGLAALTLGNCALENCLFIGCPVSRITLTGECVPEAYDLLGFGTCIDGDSITPRADNFFATVRRVYGGATGTYTLKGKLVRTNYDPHGLYGYCAECEGYDDSTRRCYTLEGFEKDYHKRPVFEWGKT